MVMVRPSNFGGCSMLAYSSASCAMWISSSRPRSESVISRPRKMTVTLTLSFFFDKPADVVQFYLDIMFAGFGPDLNFFDLESALLFFGLLLLFGLFVLIAAIVHDLTNRGACIRRNLNQIETKIAGYGERFVGRDNSDLISIRIYDPDFFCSDSVVDIGSVRSNGSVWSSWKSYTSTSLSAVDVTL